MAYNVVQMTVDTWRIEDGDIVRFFLLTGSEKAMLIDTGVSGQGVRSIVEKITDLPLSLINTHADPDHTAGNREFDSFYMHPSEASNFYKTHPGKGEFIPVYEGDIIDLGNRPLEIIALPGHTPGSIAVLDINARSLFSGDPVQDGMIFMFGVQREMHAYRISLKKLSGMKERFDRIYPSHGTIPVSPNLINELYEASGRLLDGEFVPFEVDMHGKKVRCYDVGPAKFLCE